MNELESLVINQGFNKLSAASLGGRMLRMVKQPLSGAKKGYERGVQQATAASGEALTAAERLAAVRRGLSGGGTNLMQLAKSDPRAAAALAGTGGLGLYGTHKTLGALYGD